MKRRFIKLFITIIGSVVLINNALGQHFNTGVIPDEIQPVYQLEKPTPVYNDFEDPYKGIIGPSRIKETTDSSNITSKETKEINSALTTFSTKESSDVANATPLSFDYSKSNSDRFINSPCYKELGFDPGLSPEVQNSKYENCEAAKRETQLNNIVEFALGILITGLFIVVIYRYIKRQQTEKEEKLVSNNQTITRILMNHGVDNNSSNNIQNLSSLKDNTVDKLVKLKTLLDEHGITKLEYEKIKNDLLKNI